MVQHPQLEAIHDRYMTCLRHFSEYNFPAHPNRVQDLLVKLPEVRPNPLFRILPTRDADPYSGFIWIRIQHFRLNTNPDPTDPIRIQGF